MVRSILGDGFDCRHVVLAAAAGGLFVPAAMGANLLVNGSFEQGDFSGSSGTSYNYVPTNGTSVTGWVATENGFDWHQAVEFGPAFDGFRMIDLTAGSSLGGIAQTISTVIGAQYRLTFAMSGPNFGFQDPRSVFVDVAGVSASFAAPASGTFPLNWTVETLVFTAVDSTTTLSFRGNGTGEYWGAVIDDVSIEMIPAPSSAGLMLVVGCLAGRRRSRAMLHTRARLSPP